MFNDYITKHSIKIEKEVIEYIHQYIYLGHKNYFKQSKRI